MDRLGQRFLLRWGRHSGIMAASAANRSFSHLAAAAISKVTRELAAEIIPELWLLSQFTSYLAGPVHTERIAILAILTPEGMRSRAAESGVNVGSKRVTTLATKGVPEVSL